MWQHHHLLCWGRTRRFLLNATTCELRIQKDLHVDYLPTGHQQSVNDTCFFRNN